MSKPGGSQANQDCWLSCLLCARLSVQPEKAGPMGVRAITVAATAEEAAPWTEQMEGEERRRARPPDAILGPRAF